MRSRESDCAPAFVVGTGRCGSTLLSSILRAHREVLSLSEFFTVLGGAQALSRSALDGAELWTLLRSPRQDFTDVIAAAPELPELRDRAPQRDHDGGGVAPLLLVPLPHLDPEPLRLWGEIGRTVRAFDRAPAAVQYARLFEWLRAKYARRIWVERSGASLEYVEQLARGFERARFVHLLRDGAEAALSMSRHPYFRIKLARHLARDPGLAVSACLNRDIPVDRFGAYWSWSLLRSAEVLRQLGRDRLLLMRYEDLVSDPGRQLARLAGFLRIEDEGATWLASIAVAPAPGRVRELDARNQALLERACRPGMRLLERLIAEL